MRLILTIEIYMKFFRDIGKYLLHCFIALFLLSACDADDRIGTQSSGNASLSLKINAPVTSLELKSVSSNPNEPDSWTAWERAVDGRCLYRVTAFLIKEGRLVATKDMSFTEETDQATLEFEGNFTHGTYKLMVVANYSAHSADDGENGIREYEGLTDFTSTVESLIGRSGIDNFLTLYDESFTKYELASVNGICARVPQPLSLVKDIELHPGENLIEGELLRTYSRMRIVVENHSDEQLQISALSFSDIFTQVRAYLFSGNGYIQDKTSLDVDNEEALTPFVANAESPLIVPAKGSSVVFDAYILESEKIDGEEDYSYSLSLGYNGMASYTLASTTQIDRIANISTGHYLLYNTQSETFLVAGSNRVEISALSTLTNGMELSEEFVWTLDNTTQGGGSLGSNQYYLGTARAMESDETAYYMDNPGNRSSVYLVSEKSNYFTLEEERSGWYYYSYYIAIRSNGTGQRYVRVNGSSVEGRNSLSQAGYYHLYEVEAKPGFKDLSVPLQTIDQQSGQPVMVDEIKRNDFINVVVLVRYNKNEGHFFFEVKDWQSAGGDVDFD